MVEWQKAENCYVPCACRIRSHSHMCCGYIEVLAHPYYIRLYTDDFPSAHKRRCLNHFGHKLMTKGLEISEFRYQIHFGHGWVTKSWKLLSSLCLSHFARIMCCDASVFLLVLKSSCSICTQTTIPNQSAMDEWQKARMAYSITELLVLVASARPMSSRQDPWHHDPEV